MRNNLKLGSLFDGSGGFPLGGLLSGITPVWASEIEPFPIRVTTKRIPSMKHLGDITTINGSEIEPVDIITFGSPCTDMSIAGKRAGLNGQQSCLFYEAIRIVKEMRSKTNEKYPRYIVWENVTGAFSSNKGKDFKAVLEAIISIIEPNTEMPMPEKNKWPYADCIVGDGWSIAYRTLDAQYWGVPQRRKRIYLVADFAGGSAWKVLFKSEGLSRYSPQSFRSWQKVAGYTEDCIGASSLCLNDQGGCRMDVTHDITATLRAEAHHPSCVMESIDTAHTTHMLFENHSQDTRYIGPIEIAPTVLSTYGTGGNNQPFVVKKSSNNNIANYDIRLTSEGTKNKRYNVYETEVSRTIDTGGNYPSSNQGGVAVVSAAFSQQAYDEYAKNETSCTLKASGGTYGGGSETLIFASDYIVRRLTPTECARLQGFPDWWCGNLETENPTPEDINYWKQVFETHRKITDVSKKPKSDKQIMKWLKSPHSDSAEYKMWGNGVALPNVYFVLSGIVFYAEYEL